MSQNADERFSTPNPFVAGESRLPLVPVDGIATTAAEIVDAYIVSQVKNIKSGLKYTAPETVVKTTVVVEVETMVVVRVVVVGLNAVIVFTTVIGKQVDTRFVSNDITNIVWRLTRSARRERYGCKSGHNACECRDNTRGSLTESSSDRRKR